MQRITLTLVLLACLAILPTTSHAAWFSTDDTLVSIDGTNYSTDDFKHWWMYWQEAGDSLPETPDPYINWLLLSREGARMDLSSDPNFMRETRVFLQSRTLLKLKYEEVDGTINVTDADIKAYYEKTYTPTWLLVRLFYKDEATSAAAWQELVAGTATVDDLLGRDAEAGGPDSIKEGWVRPDQVDPGWVDIFKKISVGEVVNPDEYGNDAILYYLKEQKNGSKEELARLHDGIEKKLWKEQEGAKTMALIFKLRNKYEVQVDEERLAALDINAADDTFTDAPVITTNRENVSEKQFIAVIRKLMASRPTAAHEGADAEKVVDLKNETADNIIGQSVTNWESMDRHYEEKEPFKWEYEFNFNHRLLLALEQRLFVPEAKVTAEEIKQEYEEHIGRYTIPTRVKLFLIDETQAPLDQIWAEVAVGKRFEDVLKQLEVQAKFQDVPANHLDPEVKPVVKSLADGETSQIFSAQGVRVIAHLIERIPEARIPLKRAEESIRSGLWNKKIEQERNAYLEKLKSDSEIEVRERQWQAIQKELGGA